MSQTSLDSMFEIPSYSGTSGGVPYIFYYPGESSTWIRTKSGQYFRFASHGTAATRTSPLFRIAYTVQVTPQSSNGTAGTTVTTKECSFYYGKWCGDGIIDTDKGEQCDNGALNGASNGTCSSTCQNQTVAACTGLTVTPTSVTNGGTVTYTCTGNNVTSYSIIAKNPDGTTLTSLTSASGSITLPAAPTGTYSVACYVNNQITTPAICQKTVTNTTVVNPVCTDLSVSPSSLVNGGNVTYSCNGNNVSNYSIIFKNPDNSTLQTFTTSTGSVTIPATTGTYTASCFVNGQTTTPASCTKNIINNTISTTPQIVIDKRDANTADLDGNIGNDTQTVISGNDAVFKIRVTNNGTEDLKNISLSDSMSANCAGNVTLPSSFPSTWGNFITA